MNCHWILLISVVCGTWLVTQTVGSLHDVEHLDRVGERSRRGWFSDSSKKNKTSTVTTTRRSVTTSRPQVWNARNTTKRIGWVITTTPIPSKNTRTPATRRTTTQRPATTTSRGSSWGWGWATRPTSTQRPLNSTKPDLGWRITTTPRGPTTTKKSSNIIGWDVSHLIVTTPKPIATTQISSVKNERTTTTQRPFNSGWNITTTPRPVATTSYYPNQSAWQPHVHPNHTAWETVTKNPLPIGPSFTSAKPWPTTIRQTNQGHWAITTPKPISTSSYHANQAGWVTTARPYPTTSRSPHEWEVTTIKQYLTKRPKPMTTRKPTKRPKTTTTPHPFYGYGRQNQTSPKVGAWQKITVSNTQLSPPSNSYSDQWNGNINPNYYNQYPGPKYVQTSNVIPHNNGHLGHHFVTVYDNGFRHAVPLNSRHYFEQSYHYHNSNNNNNDIYGIHNRQGDRDHERLQMPPAVDPFGQAPVLYSQLGSMQSNQNADDNSAESSVSPSAMIVGLENILIFCHFNQNDGFDSDESIFINHDDVGAEEQQAKLAEISLGLLGLVFGQLNGQGMQATQSSNGLPQPNMNQIFASLNGERVAANSGPNQIGTTNHMQSVDLDKMLALLHQQQSSAANHNSEQQYGTTQSSLERDAAQRQFSELWAAMNANKMNVEQTTMTSDFNRMVSGFDSNLPMIPEEVEAVETETPATWVI